ncbi:MAG: PadR family transcriptional regulator [Microcoleaceae cyanobacterium]
MKFEDIYQFFRTPPPIYLNTELAVCYMCSVFLCEDSYGAGLVRRLEQEHPLYRLSDTVLYKALEFLESQGSIICYWAKVKGRGRPRRMYQIIPEFRANAQELAHLWHEYAYQRKLM